MSITRVGSTKKFAEGWDGIFAGKRAKAMASKVGAKKSGGKKVAAKKPAKKSAVEKAMNAVAKSATTAFAARSATKAVAKKIKKRPAATSGAPGDETAKKSAAKRKGSTRTKRPRPELQQMELF